MKMFVVLLVVSTMLLVNGGHGKVVHMAYQNDADEFTGEFFPVEVSEDYQHEHVESEEYLALIEEMVQATPVAVTNVIKQQMASKGFHKKFAFALPICPEEGPDDDKKKPCNGWLRPSPLDTHCGAPVTILHNMDLNAKVCKKFQFNDPCEASHMGTWSMTVDGVFTAGEWNDGFELCTKHVYLSHKEGVLAAGEYKCKAGKTGNVCDFNLNSGSYMRTVFAKYAAGGKGSHSLKAAVQAVLTAAEQRSGCKRKLKATGGPWSNQEGWVASKNKWDFKKNGDDTFFTAEGSKTPTISLNMFCKDGASTIQNMDAKWGSSEYAGSLPKNPGFDELPWKIGKAGKQFDTKTWLGNSLCSCKKCWPKTAKSVGAQCNGSQTNKVLKKATSQKSISPKK